jgi:hypothetical protein
MLADELSHVLSLVARSVIEEKYDALRTTLLCMSRDIRDMALELPARPVLECVPDERVLLRPEERHEDVLPLLVVGWDG